MATATATKTASAAAKTEYRQSDVLRVSRRHRKRRNAVFVRTLAGVVGMVSLLGYIGMYAQVTMYGYRRAELTRQLRQVDMQNQALKAEIQMLTSPDRLAAVAQSAGMVQNTKIVYIASPGSTVNVAKAE